MTVAQPGVNPVPREARDYQGLRAGLVSRFVANTIDAGVVALIVVAAYAGYNIVRFFLDPRGFQLTEPAPLMSMTALLVVLVLYLTASWSIFEQTVGCQVMGLRVVGRRGGRLGPVAALLRAVACAFVPIGLLWVLVNAQNRSLQDLVLRTSVIYDWQPHATLQDVLPPREQ